MSQVRTLNISTEVMLIQDKGLELTSAYLSSRNTHGLNFTNFTGKYICDGNAGSTDGTQYRYAAPPLHEQELGSGAEC